jgi:hypothetical protein
VRRLTGQPVMDLVRDERAAAGDGHAGRHGIKWRSRLNAGGRRRGRAAAGTGRMRGRRGKKATAIRASATAAACSGPAPRVQLLIGPSYVAANGNMGFSFLFPDTVLLTTPAPTSNNAVQIRL